MFFLKTLKTHSKKTNNPIYKMGKRFEQTLDQRYMDGNKHVKKCSRSLLLGKCKLKPQ